MQQMYLIKSMPNKITHGFLFLKILLFLGTLSSNSQENISINTQYQISYKLLVNFIYLSLQIQRYFLKNITTMQSELSRILNSSDSVPLEIQLLESLNENQHEIEQLEQILQNKNNQIVELNVMIQHQLNKTMLENQKLRQIVDGVGQSMKLMRSDMVAFKDRVGKAMRHSIIQIRRQFECSIYQCFKQNQYLSNIKQTITSDAGIQTLNNHNDISDLHKKVVSLQGTIQAMKEQNQKLRQQLCQKQKSPLCSQLDYNSVSNISQFQSRIRTHSDDSPNNTNSHANTNNNHAKQDSVCTMSTAITNFYAHLKKSITDLSLLELKYTGQLVGNVKNGYGICQYKDNFVYEGRWRNGLRQDNNAELRHIRRQGSMHRETLIYKGKWANGHPEGRGQLYFTDPTLVQSSASDYCQKNQPLKYVGHFQNGKPEGYGNIFYTNGDKLRLQIKDGIIIGQALYESNDQNYNNAQYVDAGSCHQINTMLRVCARN